MEIFIFVAFALIAVIGMVFGHWAEKKRTETLRALSPTLGLSFWAEKDHGFERRYPMFDCLRSGHDRYAHNQMHGEKRGRSTVATDYHYATRSRDSKGNSRTTHHRFSVVIVDSGLNLGWIKIREEGFLDKVTGFFGWDDINFESHDFSRAFHVSSKDRKRAYDILHQEAMEVLMESPRFTLEIAGPLVLAWRQKRFEPADFVHAVDLVNRLLDLIPEDLEDELRLVSQR